MSSNLRSLALYLSPAMIGSIGINAVCLPGSRVREYESLYTAAPVYDPKHSGQPAFWGASAKNPLFRLGPEPAVASGVRTTANDDRLLPSYS